MERLLAGDWERLLDDEVERLQGDFERELLLGETGTGTGDPSMETHFLMRLGFFSAFAASSSSDVHLLNFLESADRLSC